MSEFVSDHHRVIEKWIPEIVKTQSLSLKSAI